MGDTNPLHKASMFWSVVPYERSFLENIVTSQILWNLATVSYGILWPHKLPLLKPSLSFWQYNRCCFRWSRGPIYCILEHSIDVVRYKQPYSKLALHICKLNNTCFDTSSVFLLLDIYLYNVFIRPHSIHYNS